jgi:ABC-type Fe3+ transport system substrate-binding protein
MEALRILVAAATAFAAAATASAQQPTPEQAAEWEKVVAAARKEGTVTIYSGHVGVSFHSDIGKSFEKKYGIKVQVLEARASELWERIRTEQTTNRVAGDLSHNAGASAISLRRAGFYQKLGYIPNADKLKSGFENNGYQLPIFVQSYGIAINSRLVKKEDWPKSWLDLADPKWKGKILADDFRALGGGSAYFNVAYRKLGKEFHEKLAQQGVVFSRQVRDNPRRVARGEFLIYMPFVLADTLLHEGLPLQAITPEEGNPYVTYDVAVFSNAPHPNAARLLANHFLEEESQMVYVRSARTHTIVGLDSKVPKELEPLINAKLMGASDPDFSAASMKIASEMFK